MGSVARPQLALEQTRPGTPSGITPYELPPEVLSIVLQRCSSAMLLQLRGVCKNWRFLASSDDIWAPRVVYLWEGKRSIPSHLVNLPVTHPARAFHQFWASLWHSKKTIFQKGEIYGPRVGLPLGIWCFRFKAQAGESWMQQDPWWNGRPPIRLLLKADGTMEAASNAPGLWGRSGTPAGRYEVTTENDRSVVRENGHPGMLLYRHPLHWGFYLQSAWTVWTSFPMAPRGEDPFMEDGQLEVGVDDPVQAHEIARYNSRVHGGL